MPRQFVQTPIGAICVESDGHALAHIRIRAADATNDDAPDAVTREAAAQIEAWFAGRLTRFDLPLIPLTTPRGPAHRAAIVAIPYGETASYGQLARQLGSSPRAVGQACQRNPFPIVIPCHRVVGSGGTIGHYSGGQGIVTKLWLLDHERRGGAGHG